MKIKLTIDFYGTQICSGFQNALPTELKGIQNAIDIYMYRDFCTQKKKKATNESVYIKYHE